MSSRRVLVLTVVHHPHDGRIRARQIKALLAAGWEVTFAAPWTGHGLPVPPAGQTSGLTCVDVRRASGRRRLGALREARRLLRKIGPQHDVVILHDPELVPITVGLSGPPVVWDVHEDTGGALAVRVWIPHWLRGPAAAAARALERLAERRMPLLLADERYSSRFSRTHPVVPNSTWVPAHAGTAAVPGPDGAYRVVYLGSITMERGAAELVEIGRLLRGTSSTPVRVEAIGPAHGPALGVLQAAHERGDLIWSGYQPNEVALSRVGGALAGLCLLHDEANFRPSMPTKVVEYLAQAVPVLTTPVPLAADLVERSRGGAVVPFGTVSDVARDVVAQILAWVADPESAVAAGQRGHAVVRSEWNWDVHAHEFVAELERIAEAATA